MGKTMKLDSILHDESCNMSGDLDCRMLGPAPSAPGPSNILPFPDVMGAELALREQVGRGGMK